LQEQALRLCASDGVGLYRGRKLVLLRPVKGGVSEEGQRGVTRLQDGEVL
jgi:hypothetical protein